MADGYGPIPNQRINCDVTIKLANGEYKPLQQGTYVKGISKTYIPKNHPFEDFDEDLHAAVYSPYGLGLVPKHSVDWAVY